MLLKNERFFELYTTKPKKNRAPPELQNAYRNASGQSQAKKILANKTTSAPRRIYITSHINQQQVVISVRALMLHFAWVLYSPVALSFLTC